MKKNTWTVANKLWLIFAIIVVTVSSFFTSDVDLIKILAAILGVTYTICIMKNERIAFLFGIGNVTLLGVTLFNEKAYAGAFYNIAYSLPMLIWGFISWGEKKKNKASGIRKMNGSVHNDLIVGGVVAALLCILFITNIGGENILLDVTSSILGYIGIYLMANKYMEQWNVWILSNLVNVLLWFSFTMISIANLPVLFMWLVYLANSIYGYISWKKLYPDMEEVNTLKIWGKKRK